MAALYRIGSRHSSHAPCGAKSKKKKKRNLLSKRYFLILIF